MLYGTSWSLFKALLFIKGNSRRPSDSKTKTKTITRRKFDLEFFSFFSHFLKNGYPGPQVLFTFLFRKVNTVTVILLKEVALSPGRIMF